MGKNRGVVLVVGLLASGGLVASSCGNDDETPPSTSSSTADQTDASPDSQPSLQDCVNTWNKDTNGEAQSRVSGRYAPKANSVVKVSRLDEGQASALDRSLGDCVVGFTRVGANQRTLYLAPPSAAEFKEIEQPENVPQGILPAFQPDGNARVDDSGNLSLR